jgi:predicted DCC family thiol-disulfide oxidoreductase YuxK
LLFSMQAEQSIVVDPKSPGGINSLHGLILFDGVCILCSRGCRFVSKRDRRGYFRFVPIQLAEGRPLAEQLGIDPDRPDSFAFVANGQAYVKSEAALRIARELPRWQWTWVFHFIPRVIRGGGLFPTANQFFNSVIEQLVGLARRPCDARYLHAARIAP